VTKVRGLPAQALLLAEWSPALQWSLIAGLILLLLAGVYVFRYWVLVRIPIWILSKTLYWVRIHGAENIPATGPALLVSNHVSHIDAGIIMSSVSRPVRFLIWAPFLKVFGLRHLLRIAKVIPVESTAGPRAIIQSLRTASEALARGEVVCIFAEGGITRNGFLLPFQRGLEQIVKRHPAPIIPVYLDHVWGSVFSYRGGRFFWKLPKEVPYSVYVNFGKALPATTTSPEVRQAIQELSAESAIRRADRRLPVHRQFVRMAAKLPFRPCFFDTTNDKKPMMRYGEALAGAKILMKRLKPLLKDDQMVGLWLPPSAGGALANIVVSFMGKVAVNLNYTSSPQVVRSAIQQCGIKRVLTSKLFTHKVRLDPGPGVELIYLEDFRKSVSAWERIRTFLGVILIPRFIQEYWLLGLGKHKSADMATVIFSSGSTGEPKGVMLTHGNIAANAESMIQAIDPNTKDRLMGILPFFHSFGYTVTLWVPLQVGASAIFHPNPLQAREIGETCKNYRSTLFLATPTFLRSYLKRCDKDDFKSLRLLVCGAEKLPLLLAQEFQEKFGVLPLEGYGCTELSPVVAANVPDWQEDAQRQIGNKPGTIGRPLPGVAARVVKRDTKEPLPMGEEGLLLVNGANVMKGYLNRDELTQQKLWNGWYITGDLARIDEDGFVTITGREERFAKVGGEMVPLERVEEELHQVLETTERACVVTAIPDEKRGERIIVLHLALNGKSVEQVWRGLQSRGLPPLYVPGQKDFFEVPELPILGSGKIDIKGCKEKAQELALAK
jgi:acyl-[acyl-carrier-protein]-phospholipid O-acyltransferase/long-chain-fatty-acid--[acyl-carrier-protein] ligase